MIKQLLCALIMLLSFNVYASPYAVIEAGAALVDGGVNKNDPELSLWFKGPDIPYGTKLGPAGRVAFGFQFNDNHALEFGWSIGETIKAQAHGELYNQSGIDIHVYDPNSHQPANIDVLNYSYYYEYKLKHRVDLSYLYTFTEGLPNLYLKTGVSIGLMEFTNRSIIKYTSPSISGRRSQERQGEEGLINIGWVLGLGYRLPIEKNLDLRVGYTLNMDTYFNGPGFSQYEIQIMNHSVTAGIVYKF